MSFLSLNRKLASGIFIPITIVLLLTSTKLPKNFMPHDKMVEIIIDLELAKSLAYNYNHTEDEAKHIFTQNVNLIYSTYGLSAEEFKENYIYYIDKPQDFLTLYNDVVYKLESML
jgi:hypothetical protein